ncbi:MAG TPA: helix-turn-helix transcriptional regulator [Catenuloplanes sp.]
MTDASARALGRKIAFYRGQRGLSQRDFSAMIERSETWVSQVERGVRRVDRMTVLRRVADALAVPLSELAAETPVIAAVNERPEHAVALRMLLSSSLALALAAEHGSVPFDEAAEIDVEHAWVLTHAGAYDELLPLLMRLLPTLEARVRRARGAARRRAYGELARTYHSCAAALSKLRETDAAWVAADRAIAAAEASGDPLLMAEGAFRLTLVFQADRRHEQAAATARTAVEALQPLVDGDELPAIAIQGALRLQLAIVAARQNDVDRAYEEMRLARQAGERLGDGRNDYHTEFGPTNVSLHEISVAVELGDAGTALGVASRMDASALSPERQARLLIDVARAHMQRRQFDAVIRALCQAEELTPEQVRRHRAVRALIHDLGRARLGGDTKLRDLADRCGIRLPSN